MVQNLKSLPFRFLKNYGGTGAGYVPLEDEDSAGLPPTEEDGGTALRSVLTYPELKDGKQDESELRGVGHVGFSSFSLNERKGQLGTDFLEDVPIAHGIPIYTFKKPFNYVAASFFLAFILIIIYSTLQWWSRNIIHQVIPIQDGVSASLFLQNCAVRFVSEKKFDHIELIGVSKAVETATYQLKGPATFTRNFWKWTDERHLEISLLMKEQSPSKCVVLFYLTPSFSFENLSIEFASADQFMDLLSPIPIRATGKLSIDALHAFLDMQSIEAKDISIILGDGQLSFYLNGTAQSYSSTPIYISSKVAPVKITSRFPLSLKLRSVASKYSLLRATGGIKLSAASDFTNVLLYPSTTTSMFAKLQSISVDFDTNESPIYATSTEFSPLDTSVLLHTWAGEEQLLEPHLAELSKDRIAAATLRVAEYSTAPWVLVVQTLGDIFANGVWMLLSSNAYLKKVQWFTIGTLGMLSPRMLFLQIHVLGLFCRNTAKFGDLSEVTMLPDSQLISRPAQFNRNRSNMGTPCRRLQGYESPVESRDRLHGASPPDVLMRSILSTSASLNEAPLRKLQQEERGYGSHIGTTPVDAVCESKILEDTFIVLWEALHEFRSPSTIFVWTENENEYKFTLKNYAITVKQTGLDDIWYFLVAIIINICGSVVAGAIGTYFFIYCVTPSLLEGDREKQILNTASHRLDHEHSLVEPQEWNLIATPVYSPGHGFLLRWSQGDGDIHFPRLFVHVQPTNLFRSKTENKRHAKQELFLYLSSSAIETSTDLGLNQKRMFIPIKHPGVIQLDTLQSYSLEFLVSYRIRIVAISTQGKLLKKSSWSSAVVAGAPLSVLDIPLMMINRFITPSISSLQIFMMKFARHVSYFDIPFRFEDVRLQAFDISSGTKQELVSRRYRSTYMEAADDVETPRGGDGSMEGDADEVELQHLNFQDAVISIKRNYVLNVFFGYKSQQAKETYMATGRQVFGSIAFERSPVFCASHSKGQAQTDVYLEFKTICKAIRLRKDRMTFNVIGFEVSNGVTGQVLAFGFIRFEDLYNIAREKYKKEEVEESPNITTEKGGLMNKIKNVFDCKNGATKFVSNQTTKKSEGRFRVGLEYIDGGGPWGRVECTLNMEELKYFIRHVDHLEDMEAPMRRDVMRRPALHSIPRVDTRLTALSDATSIGDTHKDAGDASANDFDLTQILANAGSTSAADGGNRRGSLIDIDCLEQRAKRMETESYGDRRKTFYEGEQYSAYFVNDAPSHPVYQGEDLFLQWNSSTATNPPDQVYLSLFDHQTNNWIASLHWGKPIPNTGSYAWHVDTNFKKKEYRQYVYIAIFTNKSASFDARRCICQTNAFIIVKPLPLSEIEFIYASFCRSTGLEMEHVSEAKLSQLGYSTVESTVKICPDLRYPLCVEPPAEAVHCPGQCIISNQSKLVLLHTGDNDGNLASYENMSGEDKQVFVYKSVSKKMKIVENCVLTENAYWWQSSPDIPLLQKNLFYSHVLCSFLRETFQDLKTRIQKSMFLSSDVITGGIISLQQNLPAAMHCIEFKLLPYLFALLIICLQSLLFCLLPVAAVYAVLNKSLHFELASGSDLLRSVDSYKNDFAFKPIDALLSLWWPTQLLIAISAIQIIIVLSAIFFDHVCKDLFPRVWSFLHSVMIFTVRASLFVVLCALTSFVLWFFLGALVNSDSFLPQAVMLGSLFFVMGMLYTNFINSRESVMKFIDDNMPLLLSLALDHWFDSVNIIYSSNIDLNSDEKLLNYQNRIRDEILEAKAAMRRQIRMSLFDDGRPLYEYKSEGSMQLHGQSSFSDADAHPTKRKRDKLVTYIFEKVSSSTSQGFYFSDKQPMGLQDEKWLHSAARFATVMEVEKFTSKVDDLLDGWEMAMLHDGIKYGPRYGYKLVQSTPSNQSFRYAIVALPRYPPADELDDLMKVQLIFDYFNKDGDSFCNEEEFRRMQLDLKGFTFEEQNWQELCAYFNDIVNTMINPEEGISVKDLSKIYSLQKGDLDRDYEKLYPTMRIEEMDEFDFEDLDRMSDDDGAESPSEGDDLSEEDESLSDNEIEEENVVAEPVDITEKTKTTEQEVRRNINARKLHFIYNYGTQEHRGQATDELLTSVSFMAMKITSTHIKLLSPIFGKEMLIGMPGYQAGRLQRFSSDSNLNSLILEADEGSAPTKVDHFTGLMRLLHIELFQELSKQFRSVHSSMFETSNVRNRIGDFYDNVMPQYISLKASRILNEHMKIEARSINSSSYALLTSFPPKIASQLISGIHQYRVESDEKIRELFMLLSKSQAKLQKQLQIHLFAEMFHSLGILESSEIVTEIVSIPLDGGHTKEQVLLLPKRKECCKVITEAIERQVLGKHQRIAPEHIVPVAKHVAANYLWFDAFIFLVQLLGINLDTDDLPGGAVKIREEEGTDFTRVSIANDLQQLFDRGEDTPTLSFELNEPKSIIRETNLNRLRSVFDQLANYSGFLPLDLSDEAILLLTDNRLNFAGVIACLQHLKIGSVHIDEGEDFEVALQAMGISKGSPVCDVWGAGESSEDKFDWTDFRKNPAWNADLYKTFDRLTASCPGFMGKSQMYEFVRDIHKLFQPQLSQLRRGRDRVRGKKKEQKEEVTQLPTVNDGYTKISGGGLLNEGMNMRPDFSIDLKDEAMRTVSFEMFHKVMVRVGFSVGYQHSRIIWIIICNQLHEKMQQVLSETDVKMGAVNLYLQPTMLLGKPFGARNSIMEITGYNGYVTFTIFRRFLRRIGVAVSEKGAKAMWEDMNKDPLDITDFLPAVMMDPQVPTKYLRLEMDPTGMDPTKGRIVSIASLKRQLPRMLVTGLWPEAVKVLLKLELQWKVNDEHLKSIIESPERKYNRFGLIRPEDIGKFLSNLSVKGMSFSMLREAILKMRINMPDKDVKRMFDLMDLNHDLNLSLSELLGGFGVLFGRFMPQLVLEQVGLSYKKMFFILGSVFVGLLAFFCFLGLAFSSFEGMKSGLSTAVQTVLAILGAVGLQSGASQEMEQVKERMRLQIEEIMGDPLSKARQQVEELQEATKPEGVILKESKPMKLRYLVPKRFRPELEDPRPCVTFHPGTHVRLEPTFSNQITRENIRWTIIPRLSLKNGLSFNEKTGVIEGVIPLKDEGDLSRIKAKAYENKGLDLLSSDEKDKYTADSLNSVNRMASARDLRVARKTYLVVARNSAGSSKTRVTFQIQPRSTIVRGGKKEGTQLPIANSRPEIFKASKGRKSIRLLQD